MTKCVNKVTLIGYLSSDPEIRHGEGGDIHAVIHLVTSESWKDKKSGETKEDSAWHRVILSKRFAEIARKFLKKGKKIYIEGKIKTHFHEKEGQKIKYTDIQAMDLQMLEAPPSHHEGKRNERNLREAKP